MVLTNALTAVDNDDPFQGPNGLPIIALFFFRMRKSDTMRRTPNFKMPSIRFLCPLVVGLFLFACANVPAPRELAAVPDPPRYPATAVPSSTPVAPKIVPTVERPTLFATDNRTPFVVPTAQPTARSILIPQTPIARAIPNRELTALNEYQRGIAYVATNRDEYRSASSQRALDELFATGANYISLLVTWYQTDLHSTEISRSANTPSDGDLAYVIEYAHAHGVKVLLKPQVDFSKDEEHWRGQIAFEKDSDWRAWFASYREFILHYARFAQQNGVQEFSVGTELAGTTTRTADWRAIIRAVRQQYTGLLTYSANHSGEEVQVRFWNDLDFIGINVFYHLTNYRTPTLEQILKGWELPVRQLTNVHNAFPDKPIIFTEVGYPSMDLASVWPWNWQRGGAVDLEEQALLYEGLFQTWWHNSERPWFRGMFIWNWTADPAQGGPEDIDFTPHGKPAEAILKYYYQLDAVMQESGVLKP